MVDNRTGFKLGAVVLVTAGASGIGRCIAETFLQQGGRVHVCDISGIDRGFPNGKSLGYRQCC